MAYSLNLLNGSDLVHKKLEKSSDVINIKLNIEYNGKNYFGWQKQSAGGKPTIQQSIEEALQVLFPKYKINLIGSGRTDTGVHAFNQAANFKINVHVFKTIGFKKLYTSLNALLPEDIAVKNIRKCSGKFNSRYSAKKRVYQYYLSEEKQAIFRDFTFRLKTKFDIELAKDFCKLLVGDHSFKHFCKNESDKHDFHSIIYYARVAKQKNGLIKFEICANRFLHSMVKALVGIMIKIAAGKISINDFKTKFKKGVPIKIQYVPSNALFLKKIIY